MVLVGASVSALIGVNQQLSPILTDDNGYFRLAALPAGKIRLFVRGNGFCSREITLETAENESLTVALELKPVKPPVGKIRVQGLEVTIADEVTFMVDATGEQLTLAQYLDYTKAKIRGYVPDWSQLHQIWTDSEQRKIFLNELISASVYIEILGEVLGQPKADQLDLLAHIAFNKPIHTRDERVEAFLNYEQPYLERQTEEAREVILGLLDKYRLAGVEEIVNPEVFRLSPFQEMGQIKGVIQRLGTMENLRQAFLEIQQRLYRQ